MTKRVHKIVKLGLAQIPVKDLRRLLKYIDDEKPLLLDGHVYDKSSGFG